MKAHRHGRRPRGRNEFFAGLGLELQGEGPAEGRWVNRVMTLEAWNQQGSHVLRGSLLVIPSSKALLYAEPIYLQAQQSPMPELRLVVLALQDRLAYGPTFEAALASLFGGEVSGISGGEPAQAPAHAAPPGAAQPAPDLNALITEAGKDFDDYQRLTAEGKLGEAEQKLDQLKAVLGQLNAHRK